MERSGHLTRSGGLENSIPLARVVGSGVSTGLCVGQSELLPSIFLLAILGALPLALGIMGLERGDFGATFPTAGKRPICRKE